MRRVITPVMQARKRLKHDNKTFKASLGCIVKPVSKTNMIDSIIFKERLIYLSVLRKVSDNFHKQELHNCLFKEQNNPVLLKTSIS